MAQFFKDIRRYSEQFESQGQDFVYRRSGSGEPFLVTAEERSAMIAQYRSWYGNMLGAGMVITMFVFVPACIILTGVGVPGLPMFLCYAALLAFSDIFGRKWLWDAPSKTLARRRAGLSED